MNLNSAALKMMLAKGLTLEDVAEIVAANEKMSDPTAAERQARCRARKRSRVTSRRDTPPNDSILTPPEVTPTANAVDPTPIEKSKKGTRLPDNWELPTEWRQWAKDRKGWTDAEIDEEALIFRNHWTAKSGAAALHTNWFRVWQNWVVRSYRKATAPAAPKMSDEQEIAALKRMIEAYSQAGRFDDIREARRRIAELEGQSSGGAASIVRQAARGMAA